MGTDAPVSQNTMRELICDVLEKAQHPMSALDVYWAIQSKVYDRIKGALKELEESGSVTLVEDGLFALVADEEKLEGEAPEVAEPIHEVISIEQQDDESNRIASSVMTIEAATSIATSITAEDSEEPEASLSVGDDPDSAVDQTELVSEAEPNAEFEETSSFERSESVSVTDVERETDAPELTKNRMAWAGYPTSQCVQFFPGFYLPFGMKYIASISDDISVLPLPGSIKKCYEGKTIAELVADLGRCLVDHPYDIERALLACSLPLGLGLNSFSVGALETLSGSRRFVFDQLGSLRSIPTAAEVQLEAGENELCALILGEAAPVSVFALDISITLKHTLKKAGFNRIIDLFFAGREKLSEAVGQLNTSVIDSAIQKYSNKRLSLDTDPKLIRKLIGFSRMQNPVKFSSYNSFQSKFSVSDISTAISALTELEQQGYLPVRKNFMAVELPFIKSKSRPGVTLTDSMIVEHALKIASPQSVRISALRQAVAAAAIGRDAGRGSDAAIRIVVRDGWSDAAEWIASLSDGITVQGRDLIIEPDAAPILFNTGETNSDSRDECSLSGASPDVIKKSSPGSEGPGPKAFHEAERTLEAALKKMSHDDREMLNRICDGSRIPDAVLPRARKVLYGLHVVADDRYAFLYRMYNISLDQLEAITGSERVARYIAFKYYNGTRDIAEAPNDTTLPQDVREAVQRVLMGDVVPQMDKREERSLVPGDEAEAVSGPTVGSNSVSVSEPEGSIANRGNIQDGRSVPTINGGSPKDCVVIDGKRIPLAVYPLARAVLKSCANDPIPIASFVYEYNKMLKQNGLECRRTLRLPTVSSSFKNTSFALVDGSDIRYFLWSKVDFGAIRDMLAAESKRNIECSCSLLFDAHPEFMRQCDIRSGDELHIVLKHMLKENPVEHVELGFRPLIKLGECSRERQLVELIREHGTISRQDLVAEYAQKYGLDQRKVNANYLGLVKQYQLNGRYEYIGLALNDEQKAYLRSILNKDCVTLADTRLQMTGKYPAIRAEAVNADVLRDMGYKVSAGLVFRDNIDVSAYFKHLIGSRDAFTCGDQGFSEEVFKHPVFHAILHGKVKAHEYVEIEDRSFVSATRLEQAFGYGLKDLDDYAEAVVSFAEKDVPFTFTSLKNAGFSHELDRLRDEAGLTDTFYASIMESEPGTIKRGSLGGTPVMCRCGCAFSAVNLIEWIVGREGALDYEEIQYRLNDDYGIEVTDAVLKAVVGRSNLFVGETMGIVCKDKEAYKSAMISLAEARRP